MAAGLVGLAWQCMWHTAVKGCQVAAVKHVVSTSLLKAALQQLHTASSKQRQAVCRSL